MAGDTEVRYGVDLAVPVVPPTDREWQAEQQRIIQRTSGTGYDDQGKPIHIPGATPDAVFNDKNAGESVRRLHRTRTEMQDMLKDMRWFPWSVVNLMPYPLNVNGVIHSRIAVNGNQIPACTIGSPYVQKVLGEVHWDVKDLGAGFDNIDNFSSIPWIPKKLAEDYIHEFIDGAHWGVMAYEGEAPPDSSSGLKHKLQEAEQARNRYLVAQCQVADAIWGMPNRRIEVVNHHRDAAAMALHLKLISRKPEWLVAGPILLGQNTEPCPNCGEIPEKRFAQCKTCGFVYDPLRAYKMALIPYGDLAMDRMTSEQWAEANEIKAQRDLARSDGEAGKKAKPKTGKEKDEK
jgi:hypothetical protein